MCSVFTAVLGWVKGHESIKLKYLVFYLSVTKVSEEIIMKEKKKVEIGLLFRKWDFG